MTDPAGLYVARGDGYWWSGSHRGPAWNGADPPSGGGMPLIGYAYTGGNINTQLEADAGRVAGVHRTYWNANQVSSAVTMAQSDVAAGRVPWLSFKLPDTWTQAKGGACDAWAKDIYAQLGALDGPIMVTWHHEPEGDESPFADFVAMHTRLYGFNTYSNIKVGPIFILYDWVYGSGYDADAYWPTEFTAGDFFGFDQYCTYGTAGHEGSSFWYMRDMYLENWVIPHCQAWGVPYAIGEFGLSATGACRNRAATGGNAEGTSGGKVDWINDVIQTTVDNYDKAECLAVCYFDSYGASTTNITKVFNGTTIGTSCNGSSAWVLEDQGSNKADDGTPSKYDTFLPLFTNGATEASWT